MTETMTQLPETLQAAMQHESFVLLSTVDAETGWPNTTAISWIYAAAPDRLRFAVDLRSRIVANIQHQSLVNVALFASGTVFAIYGTAHMVKETLEGVPFKLACFEISISAVRDAMFYGSRISVLPEYEKTYDKRAAAKLDGQVFAAMKNA